MGWLTVMSAVVAVGTLAGVGAVEDPIPSNDPVVSGEPAPGGDVAVRYWGWMVGDNGVVVEGVGAPGATITLSTPGLAETANGEVAEDGTWSVALMLGAPPERVDVAQVVGGVQAGNASVGLGDLAPGEFAVTDSQGVSQGDYVQGVGTGGDVVAVSAPARDEDVAGTVAWGWFTIPQDGTWFVVLPPELGHPVYFDAYRDGTWVAGRRSDISSDFALPYQVGARMTGTRVDWWYLDGAARTGPVSGLPEGAIPTVTATVTAPSSSAASGNEFGGPALVAGGVALLGIGVGVGVLIGRRRGADR